MGLQPRASTLISAACSPICDVRLYRGTTMPPLVEVKVPDIGDLKDVPIIEVTVKSGDKVKSEDPLITLESDKASMEVPSPAAGTVKDVKVKIGDKVSAGSLILTLETGVTGAAPAAPAAARGARSCLLYTSPSPRD